MFTNIKTADDLALEKMAAEGLEATRLAKQTGEFYLDTGIKVSFKSQDAIGVLQVKGLFEFGGTETNIKFSNGQVLPMTAADFPAFAEWFATERNRFFI